MIRDTAMIQIQSICADCLQRFTAMLQQSRISGTLRCHCEHNNVLLTSSVENGVILNWTLLPCATRTDRETAPEIGGDLPAGAPKH